MVVALWVKPWTWLTSMFASLFMVGDACKGSSVGKNGAAKSMVVLDININGSKCSWEVDGIEVIDGGGGGGIGDGIGCGGEGMCEVDGMGCDVVGICETDGIVCDGMGRGSKIDVDSRVVVGRGIEIGIEGGIDDGVWMNDEEGGTKVVGSSWVVVGLAGGTWVGS